MPRLCGIFPRGSCIRQLVLFTTLLYAMFMFVVFFNTNTVFNNNNNNNNVHNDREVLLGKFLKDESETKKNFSFEDFKTIVASSLGHDEFGVKLDPEVFLLKEISAEKYFVRLSVSKGVNDDIVCFGEGTEMELSEKEKRSDSIEQYFNL